MSRHDDRVTLRQMLDHAEEAVALAGDRTRTALAADRMLFLALLKLVEIVGEAASRVSEPILAAHPEIPWREMVGTRNRLIHGYDAVDADILWDIVVPDFPLLVKQINDALENV
jgi:uncharacterized protein with HEPN domain